MTQPDPQTPPPGQPVPPPADGRWPAWLVDTAIAAAGAVALVSAFATAVSAVELVQRLMRWRAARGPRPIRAAAVRRWLVTEMIEQDVIDNVTPAIRDLATEGTFAGVRSAQAVLDHVEEFAALPGADGAAVTLDVDWGRWQPGNPEAARMLLSADGREELLSRIWYDALIQVKGIAATRVDEIAAVLADGLERGASIEEMTTALRGVIDDPKWARTVAWTESNRATSAAALADYMAEGMAFVEWMTAFDQRVCPVCAANEAAGPVPAGYEFPSGDRHPPGHPRCRCGLLPVIEGIADPDDLDKAARRGDNRGWEHYWTATSEGRAKWVDHPHPTTALQRHLRKHMSAQRAWRTAATWHHKVFGIWPGEKKGSNPLGKG